MSSKDHPDLMGPLWDNYQMLAYGHMLEPGQQYTECKRAYYAGVFGAITTLTHLVSAGEEITAADFALVDQLLAETNSFFQAETAIHNAMN